MYQALQERLSTVGGRVHHQYNIKSKAKYVAEIEILEGTVGHSLCGSDC